MDKLTVELQAETAMLSLQALLGAITALMSAGQLSDQDEDHVLGLAVLGERIAGQLVGRL